MTRTQVALLFFLGAATGACFLLGCTRSSPASKPGNLPAVQANTQANTEGTQVTSVPVTSPQLGWLDHSPLQSQMRAMWVECGIIVLNADESNQGDGDSIECAADNIARKASRLSGLWRTLANCSLDTGRSAKTGEWDKSSEHYGRIWKSCCDCHVENWPLSLRGFTPAVVDAWLAKNSALADAPWSGAYAKRLQEPPKTPLAVMMRGLNDQASELEAGLQAQDGARADKAAREIWAIADAQSNIWGKLQAHARSIQAAAQRGDLAAIKPTFAKLAAECAGCHAAQVADARSILNPLPWK